MEKTYLSREGYDKMLSDLEFLKSSQRREIAKQLEIARSFGDLRENSEYESAKQAMAMNEIRIRELEDKLARAEILTGEVAQTDKILLGSKVRLWDLDFEEEVLYELVGSDEADPGKDRISINSPVAKALLGHTAGETIEVQVPRGVLRYKITEISR